jgi:hypothetical protein
VRILSSRNAKKIEDIVGEDQFGFKRGKLNRDGIGMLRIISEQSFEIDKKLCLLHRLAKLFKMDQINSDTKRNWY